MLKRKLFIFLSLGISIMFCLQAIANSEEYQEEQWRKQGIDFHRIESEESTEIVDNYQYTDEKGTTHYVMVAKDGSEYHNYSAMQQFHRYFDLAVSQTMHPEIFGGVRSESEGMRLVKKSIRHCVKIGRPWLIFAVVTQNAGKLLGYKLGQRYQRLPVGVAIWCTMNRSFWQEETR